MTPYAIGPDLSVIVVSFNPPSILSRCLAALTPQIRPGQSELLVIGRWQDAQTQTLSTLKSQFPDAIFVQAPAQETIPHMRLRGITATIGRLVALLEDDCVVGSQWCQAIISVHEATDQPAVGGAIEPDDYPTLLDWAVYFCEYGRFMEPFSGPVAVLPGNNVSYKRRSLPPPDSMPDGLYEVLLHWRWQKNGRTLIADPNMTIRSVNRWTGVNVTQIPYRHGRSFAALRSENQPVWKRLLRVATTPFLPFLQVGRIIKEVILRGRFLTKLILALPWMFLFYSSWALGELAGYLSTKHDNQAGWR